MSLTTHELAISLLRASPNLPVRFACGDDEFTYAAHNFEEKFVEIEIVPFVKPVERFARMVVYVPMTEFPPAYFNTTDPDDLIDEAKHSMMPKNTIMGKVTFTDDEGNKL